MSKHRHAMRELGRIAGKGASNLQSMREVSAAAQAEATRLADEFERRLNIQRALRVQFIEALAAIIPGLLDSNNRRAARQATRIIESLRRQGVHVDPIAVRWGDGPRMPFDRLSDGGALFDPRPIAEASERIRLAESQLLDETNHDHLGGPDNG